MKNTLLLAMIVVLFAAIYSVYAVNPPLPVTLDGNGGGGGGGCLREDPTVTYQYTPRKWVSQIAISNIQLGGGGLSSFIENYAYDDVGNLKQLNDTTGNPNTTKRTSFSYDALNRLTGAQASPGYTDYDTKAGRYFDTINWVYTNIGNIKKNYELEYCYDSDSNPNTPPVCGDDITITSDNRLLKVRVKGAVWQDALATQYEYDPYGNLKREYAWQEIPIGGVEYITQPAPAALWVYGIDDAKVGDRVKVLYYHEANPLISSQEYAAWGPDGANQLTVEKFPAPRSPYWDGVVYYQNGVKLTSGKAFSVGTILNANDFYGTDNLNNNLYLGYPYIKQYFRAYKQKTTCYFWDYANRLTQWVDSDGSCMLFAYDQAGNRIKKMERTANVASELAFDGSSSYVSASGNNLNLNGEYVALEAWVKLDSVSANCDGIVSKGNQGGAAGSYELLACPSPDPTKFRVKFRITTQSNQVIETYGGLDGQFPVYMPFGVWTHVAGKFAYLGTVGNDRKLGIWGYCNGAFCAKYVELHNAVLKPASDPLTIGVIANSRAQNGPGHVNGKIDEVRVWNNDYDVIANWYKEPVGTETGLIGYWKFNDMVGGTARDSSNSGYTGTLINNPVWTFDRQQDNLPKVTKYVTQGNNVIFEDSSTAGFTCPPVTNWNTCQ